MLEQISVIVVTRNAAAMLQDCLDALKDFSHVIVVDSGSVDDTVAIAQACGLSVVDFSWNGQYPKKRQWCLEHIAGLRDFVFFVDADEIVTPALVAELHRLDGRKAGYFVRGQYVFGDKVLRHGLRNHKLCLINRHLIHFPPVDDLDIAGMGEIEGHYQPVLRMGARGEIGQVKAPLLHYAYDENWQARHERYAVWQSGVEERKALPADVSFKRRFIKAVFSVNLLRPYCAFLHSYVLKMGFLDGGAGFYFAASRYRYYMMVNRQKRSLRANKSAGINAAHSSAMFAPNK